MSLGLFLQFGGFFGGGSVGSILSYWEQAGFFSYVLPFLLIFALVFGILTRIKVFDDKALNGVIAFVVGLLALQFNFVPIFFSEIFPRIGIALSIILALLILVGLFFDPNNKVVGWGLLAIGTIIFITVLVKTFGPFGFGSGISYLLWQYTPHIIGIVLFLVILGVIVSSGNPPRPLPDYQPILFQPSRTRP